MGKVMRDVTSQVPSPAPDHLTMHLFAPGMALLHRAGLGGLACTLKAMERQHRAGLLRAEHLPASFEGNKPPWDIDEQTVTLRFGKPENAGEYLRKLFAFAFQIRERVIYLPGQYLDPPPPLAVRAAIQDGIQNTFLQHGPTCGSRIGERTVTISVDETLVTFNHDMFTSYKHQGWFWLEKDEKAKEKDPITGKKNKTGRRVQNHQSFPAVSSDGTLSGLMHKIDIKLAPGAMVRHESLKEESAIRESDAGLICLHFALVGCLALSVNKVTAALLIPEVSDLLAFADQRRWLTPQTIRECRIAGAADAALQGQVRVRARQTAVDMDVPSCLAMTLKPTQWNQKQKCRVATVQVQSGLDSVLDRFERALTWLPPRLRRTDEATSFWSDSIVRPLIAENLAAGRQWYRGFVRLYRSSPSQLRQERGGLRAMATDPQMGDNEREQVVVLAVHDALRARYRDIANIYRDRPQLMEQKFADEAERWGRAFADAMTTDQFRRALCELFRRGGQNPELQKRWQDVLPMLRPDAWELTRDLAIIGVCSYERRDKSNSVEKLAEAHQPQETAP